MLVQIYKKEIYKINIALFVCTYDNVGGVGSAVPCTESGGGQFAIRKWVVGV